MESKTLIEEQSPLCPIVAFVEESNQCVYFYLMEHPDSEARRFRTVWVRNYGEAPDDISSVEDMRSGLPPRLPASFCAHPDGAEKLSPEKLEIVWFEEGDAAALLYEEDVLAVIPGWGGNDEYPGYARDCIGMAPYGMPLGDPSENVLFKRVEQARQFWQSWDEESWPQLQASLLQAIENSLGKHTKYYAIDGGSWPPRAMITIEQGDITYVVTVGVSLVPQPVVEQYTEEPEKHRRIELALALPTVLLQQNEQGILQYISGLPNIPWQQITWIGHGHTINSDQFSGDEEFTAILLVQSPEHAPHIPFASYRGDDISLLWMVPITEAEHEYAMQNSSMKLLQKAKETTADSLWLFDGQAKFSLSR
ncbi:Suppressor of fused protein (SUFU) [Aneurinibacillus migulanus]|uniref:suppressor of fused domain protein n=1 Tax=Aneurinibacillus migulanus TaxID=47500 RepID=UPI0005BC498E|nr:suppressor of fused domain protein [Aneurinibacillus migulanus]KIV57166.1 Suppressor of fused protein (SUFU) [Aneurinibacillus migulanus]KPD07592.1 Suppressor of fused protein (SUFU) [Aneurinibacillus migulanus]MED4729646.1 suppressor of fused domain protein [Aneurinibacillus migulanus]CEH28829.1 Uncharacterized protein BN1090_A2_01252 [Aneurinibacillus migulanus]